MVFAAFLGSIDLPIYSSTESPAGEAEEPLTALLLISKGYFHAQPYKEQQTPFLVWQENRNVEIALDSTVNTIAEEDYKPLLTWATHSKQSVLVQSLGFSNMEEVGVE